MSNPRPGTPCGPERRRGPAGNSMTSVNVRPLAPVVDCRINRSGIHFAQKPGGLLIALPRAMRSAHGGAGRCDSSFPCSSKRNARTWCDCSKSSRYSRTTGSPPCSYACTASVSALARSASQVAESRCGRIASVTRIANTTDNASASQKERKILRNRLLIARRSWLRSEEHTSELQSPCNLVCRLLLEKKKNRTYDLTLSHT